MFVSFVRKFTQGLDLSYEQLNALSTAMAGLLARIVGGNEALRKENMFQYRPDSFEQSAITPKLKVSFAEQRFLSMNGEIIILRSPTTWQQQQNVWRSNW